MWIEPQGWALLSGIADFEKTMKIVEAMRKELYTPYGVKFLSPSFKKYRDGVGQISNEIPGTEGNGSIDLLSMFFYTYGLTQVSRPDEAFDLLNRILPTNPKNPPEKSKTEPFQISSAFQGPDSHQRGRAISTGKTGAAGWFLKTVWDGMIGICPDMDCVKVNVRLPKAFGERIEVNRVIRGRNIRFEIAKPGFETKDAAFTMRVKNGDDISYKDISENELVLIII
jgi:cellobionic acid phosphorylase